jgi:hypothetical protein
MYILPADFDFEMLSNCYLEMICFGPNVTRLDFSRAGTEPGNPYRVSCVLEGVFSFICNGVVGERDLNSPISIAPLLSLLMRDVDKMVQTGPASLRIDFVPDGSIMFEGDRTADFESYTIYPNVGDPIVV